MPLHVLALGACVFVLGLGYLCRLYDGTVRFVLLVAWMAAAGVVLALNTDFSCSR